MCKFLVPEGQTVASQVQDSLHEKSKAVLVLEQENKKLEEALIKNIGERKSLPGPSAKISLKLEDLMKKLKKLDEIALGLEEKNKSNEIIIKKQNKLISQLKKKCEDLQKEKEDKKLLEDKINELQALLADKNKENDSLKESLRNKSFELSSDLDVSQNLNLFSDVEPIRKLTTTTSTTSNSKSDSNEKRPNFFKMKSEVINFNEMDKVSYFEQTLQSERKISLTSEENQSFMLQMEEAKKNKDDEIGPEFGFGEAILSFLGMIMT